MDRSQEYFYAGATSLAEQLDKTVLAILRDGRHLIGRLISFDHFGSLVLQEARERHIAGGKFCDLPMGGVYVIRGENLTLLGEIDEALDATHPQLEEAEWEEVSRLEQEAQERAAAAAAAASTSGRVASVAHAGAGEKAQAATIPQIWNMGEA